MIVVNTDNYEQEVLQAGGLVVVDFWGTTCRNCKALAPKYEALAEENAQLAKFCTFNAMENKPLSIAQKVVSVPTIVFYRNGEQIDRLSGVFTVDQISDKVKELSA